MNNNSTNYNNKNNVSKYKNKQTYDYNHSKNIPFYHNAYYDYPDNGKIHKLFLSLFIIRFLNKFYKFWIFFQL